jgi:hypothetical protein
MKNKKGVVIETISVRNLRSVPKMLGFVRVTSA